MDRPRISILPPRHRCADCGAACEPGVTYDPAMAERVDCWFCPECSSKFYRADSPGGGVSLRGVARRLRR